MTSLAALLGAAPAAAAVRVEIPEGWQADAGADDEARSRASTWAQAAGLQILQIGSSAGEDDYAETVVVLERNVPLSREAALDAELALAQLTSDLEPMLGTSGGVPESSAFLEVADGRVFHGRWIVDGITYDCLLVPSAATYGIVVTSFRSEDAVLYATLIDELLASVSGVETPVAPFDRAPWRWGAWGVWLALGAALYALMSRFTDRTGDHRGAARTGAILLLVLAAIGASISYFLLAERDADLVAAGTSVGGVVGEVFVTAAFVAALMIGVAYLFDRGERVRSAPENPSRDVYRRAEPRAGLEPVSPRHDPKGDGHDAIPGHVEPADDERGRTPGSA